MFSELDLEKELLAFLSERFPKMVIKARHPLAYGAGVANTQVFKVDLLLEDPPNQLEARARPRLAIELKVGGINTHDLLAYSRKASLHRALCGYLRYGLFVSGDRSGGVTAKYLWHGHEFDFMMSCAGRKPSSVDLAQLGRIVSEEVRISRLLERWVSQRRGPYRNLIWRKAVVG